MKKLKKRNNKSVSKFQQGKPILWLNRNSGKSYITLEQARALGLPLYADTNDPQSNAAFDYRISDPTGMNRPSTIGGQAVNPQTTYVEFDPSLGTIMNTSGSSIILPEDNIQLTPIDNTWVFHPRVGWLQPNTNNGEITNPDTELTRNFLGNTLGWEQAYRVPQQTVSNMGDATASAMVQSAAGALGGEVLGTGLNYVSKILPFAPRITTAVGSTVATAMPAYADYNTYVQQINDLDKYMLGLNNFTLTDLNNLKRIYGDDYLNQLFGWLNASNYNVQPVDNNTFDIQKNERDLSLTDPKSWVDAGILKPEDPMALTGWLTNRYVANPKKQKEATKLKRNGFRRFLDWGIPLTWLGVKAYRINDALHNQKRDRIVRDVISVLRGQGMNINGSSTQPYQVQTNSQGQPQIDNSQTSNIVQDSAATTVPYNEGQTGSEQDSINQDYYGWENDTAQ